MRNFLDAQINKLLFKLIRNLYEITRDETGLKFNQWPIMAHVLLYRSDDTYIAILVCPYYVSPGWYFAEFVEGNTFLHFENCTNDDKFSYFVSIKPSWYVQFNSAELELYLVDRRWNGSVKHFKDFIFPRGVNLPCRRFINLTDE